MLICFRNNACAIIYVLIIKISYIEPQNDSLSTVFSGSNNTSEYVLVCFFWLINLEISITFLLDILKIEVTNYCLFYHSQTYLKQFLQIFWETGIKCLYSWQILSSFSFSWSLTASAGLTFIILKIFYL